jgi:hypothetical protein
MSRDIDRTGARKVRGAEESRRALSKSNFNE